MMTTHHLTMENSEQENRKLGNILRSSDIFLNVLHLMQSKDYQQFRHCDNMPLSFVETVKAFCTDCSVTQNRRTNNVTKWLNASIVTHNRTFFQPQHSSKIFKELWHMDWKDTKCLQY